jgi:hypothetical protein
MVFLVFSTRNIHLLAPADGRIISEQGLAIKTVVMARSKIQKCRPECRVQGSKVGNHALALRLELTGSLSS